MKNNEKEYANQYKAILNNLLDVSARDASIFTSINNKKWFDFYTVFGPEVLNFVFKNSYFDIPIIETNLKTIYEKIEKCAQSDELINILEEYNLITSQNQIKKIQSDFENSKSLYVNTFKSQFQKQTIKWKLFLNEANEINEQNNIWPMHLGFVYIKVSLDKKPVYAPLFLKEVHMTIRNGKPYLFSDSDIKINEKLLFLLETHKFNLEINTDFNGWSIEKLFNYLKHEWRDFFNFNVKLNSPFIQIDSESVENEALEFMPGIVLGLFQPSGGYLRNRMLEIIQNNELNQIFDIEFNKTIYKNKVKSVIDNPKVSIFKISPSNFSQDKAIASSLNQNTIIWGPPGTGKSQTIVNLLTNILVNKKTAVVCSQKKAALDVIKKRLNKLNIFGLFMLNSRGMSKKDFYRPLKKYIDYLENFEETGTLKAQKLINQSQLNFVQNIHNFCNDSKFESAAKVIIYLQDKWNLFTQELWNFILTLPNDLKYPESFNFKDEKDLKNYLLRLNHLEFKFWNQNYKKINNSIGKILFEKFNNLNLNLNYLKQLVKNLNASAFEYINDLINILPEENINQLSDIDSLRIYITKLIINKIDNFNSQEKSEYADFSAAIRLMTIEPYKFIKLFSSMIKKLFPIIIVTPEIDLSAWNKEEFDYAILDESSQIFIEKGLPVLYLAKIKILAGDDQQMRPSNWFNARYVDEDSVYGKIDSLLDFAKSLGVYNILLDKNYRSNYAALMTFSSKYFYDSALDVIDSYNENLKYQPIEVYEINGLWDDNKNIEEALYAIKLAKINLKEYKKIILLSLNVKQHNYILEEIVKNHPDLEQAINEEKLLLRNIENIQGDEADLVIVSISYDKNTALHSTFVGRNGGKNALNVAISRAKEKMIVLKSLKAEEVNVNNDNEDLLIFKKWLQFLELNNKEKKNYINKNKQELSQEVTNEYSFQNVLKQQQTTYFSSSESVLFEEIKAEIEKLIENKDYLELKVNESIGTLSVDLVIQNKGINTICFIIDNYDYQNQIENYIKINDLKKYIESKRYNIYLLDRFKWEKNKIQILDEINQIKPFDLWDTLIQEVKEEKNASSYFDNIINNIDQNTELPTKAENEVELIDAQLNQPVLSTPQLLITQENLTSEKNIFSENNLKEETIEIIKDNQIDNSPLLLENDSNLKMLENSIKPVLEIESEMVEENSSSQNSNFLAPDIWEEIEREIKENLE